MNQEKKHFSTMLKTRKNKRGFSLLELIIAIFILSVGITSALGLIVSTVRNSMDTRNAVIASGLAQEGVELVRNIRDNNMLYTLADLSRDSGSIFKTNGMPGIGASYCIFDYNNSMGYSPSITCSANANNTTAKLYRDTTNGFYSHASSGAPTSFRRYVHFRYLPDIVTLDGVEITSYVWWGASDTFNPTSRCDLSTKCIKVSDYLSRRD